MTTDFDLIIFDCDGTLTDSEFLNNQAMVDVLAEDGFDGYTLEYAYANWMGHTLRDIVLQIQMETGRMASEDIGPKYIRRVAKLQETALRPVEGAAELVRAAKDKFKICVASNGERTNVIQSLIMTGLMEFFTEDTVFTKIQVPRPKPYPDLFLYAAEQMGADPSRCVVIEDSRAGVCAGVAAGMTTWGFTGSNHDGAGHGRHLEEAGAHAVFARLIHIKEKLGL